MSTTKTRQRTGSASGSGGFNIMDYYYGDIRREFIEDRLKHDGDFLMRKNQSGDAMVVSVSWQGKMRHYTPVKKSRGHHIVYTFGTDEYNSVSDLIETHWRKRIPLPDAAKTLLLKPIKCPKTLYRWKDIDILGKLGDGNFGEVFKVRIKSENLICAMKTLKEDVSEEEHLSFQKELDMMKTMCHENIVQWIGTVELSRGSSEMKILLELVNQGSLEKLVRKGKVSERGKKKISMQVARGLTYLHRHHIIHRDMAARNVLVHADERGAITAKVSDFGLSRIDESGQGYELKKAQKLPVKWLAPECFAEKRWTMASDVWSFGILMWEVFSDGQIPYSDKNFTGAQLSKFVMGGGHPDRPAKCGNDIYDVMRQCWKHNPDKRPPMDQLAALLEDIYEGVKDRSTPTVQ